MQQNEKKCSFCNESLEKGVVFINEKEIIHRALPEHSGAHIECYIQMLYKQGLEKPNKIEEVQKCNSN